MDPQKDEQVAKLLGGLKRVNAPENFESRVRARLSTSPSGRYAFLKLAVPTAALAGLGLFLFLSGYLTGEIQPVDVAATENKAPVVEQEAAPSTSNPVVSNEAVPPPNEFRAAETDPVPPATMNTNIPFKSRKNLNRGGSQDSPGGSYDSTLNPDKPILPGGFDTNSRPGPAANIEREMRRPSIPASDVLRYTGAVAEFRGSGWTVSSVVQKSVAERIGMKAGDVIVSLNDIRLGKATVIPSGVDIKVIRVRRGGNIVDLRF